MSFQMRSTIAMTVKTPSTAVGSVKTVVLLAFTCVISRLGSKGEQTGNAIHLGFAIPKTIKQAQVYEDWGYDYDCPGDCD